MTGEEIDPQQLLIRFFKKPEVAAVLARAVHGSTTAGSIPKVIHQIWLGSPLPRRLQKLRETWMRLHPSWEFRLWTDADVPSLECRDLLAATGCYGQKSDVMRAEILYRHGGFYVDLDYECLRAMDPLLKQGSFVVALRWIVQAHLGWPAVWPEPLVVCNSLFGAEAGHGILKRYLDEVRKRWGDRERLEFAVGELDQMSVFAMGGRARVAHLKETGLRTYLPFHEVVWRSTEERSSNIRVLPPQSFHPHLQSWVQTYAMPQFWKAWRGSQAKFPRFWEYSRVRPDSFARHLSNTSWLDA